MREGPRVLTDAVDGIDRVEDPEEVARVGGACTPGTLRAAGWGVATPIAGAMRSEEGDGDGGGTTGTSGRDPRDKAGVFNNDGEVLEGCIIGRAAGTMPRRRAEASGGKGGSTITT